jgi:hypothetical protein
MIYLGGAYDKLHEMFLSGGRLGQLFSFYFGSHEGVAIPYFFELMTISAWATVVLEFALSIGLFVPRLRRFLLPAGIAFHAIIYWSMPVSTFSLMVVLMYLSYLPEEGVDRFLRAIERDDSPPLS